MKAIDLGLSVMWGDCNLGASCPEKSGRIFTWIDATKKEHGLDIAGQMLGKGWRLPTYQEVEELLSNLFEPKYSPFSFGIQVHGKNGNSIFLPASNIDLNVIASTKGQYWSSTLEDGMPGYASQFRFDQRGVYGGYNKIEYKQSIRPVFDPQYLIHMEFTYSFTINSRPAYNGTVRLPLINNMVHFGQFRPDDILNKNLQCNAIVGVNHYESAAEFRNDCEAFVHRVNATISNSDIQGSFQEALIYIVENHIRRCGRIFINDLMAYMDTFCELLVAIGWNKETTRKEYPALLLALVKKYNNYVLEAFNDFNGNHIPFIDSARYNNLICHVAKEFPYLV